MAVGALRMNIAVFVEGQQVGRAAAFRTVGDGVGQGQSLLLEGRGDVQALDTVAAAGQDQAIEGVFVFRGEGGIDAVEAKVAQPGGVQEGAQAVMDGVTDHTGNGRAACGEPKRRRCDHARLIL